jgi:hypothetical protein
VLSIAVPILLPTEAASASDSVFVYEIAVLLLGIILATTVLEMVNWNRRRSEGLHEDLSYTSSREPRIHLANLLELKEKSLSTNLGLLVSSQSGGVVSLPSVQSNRAPAETNTSFTKTEGSSPDTKQAKSKSLAFFLASTAYA